MSFTELVDALLAEKGWSRRYLAKIADIPPSTLQSAMERGGGLTAERLQKVANALGVSVIELIGADQKIEVGDTDTGESATIKIENLDATQKYLARKRVVDEIKRNVDSVNLDGAKRIAEYSRDIGGNPKYQRKPGAEEDE